MKKSLLLAVGILMAAVPAVVNAQSGWHRIDTGVTEDINSISFTDFETGTVVGESALILRTTDGGLTWVRQSCGPTDGLLGVSFIGPDRGVAVGHGGTIVHTFDGGDNWLTCQSGWMISYYAAQMMTEDLGFTMGVNTIFQPLFTWTEDGWENLNHTAFYLEHQGQNHEGTIRDMIFTTADIGHAVATVWNGDGAIVRTTDGGRTWETKFWCDTPLLGIHFPVSGASLIGFAVGDVGTICKTSDGGNSWHIMTTGAYVTYNDVFFVDFEVGYAVGDRGFISKSTDGGANWEPQFPPCTDDLYAVQFFGPDTGYAAGSDGTVLYTFTGGEPEPSPVTIDMIPHNPPITVPPGGSFTYTGVLINNTDQHQLVDVGLYLDVPGIGRYGPIDGILDVPLDAYDTLIAERIRQRVPRFAPLGEYNYVAICGDYPRMQYDSVMFEFTVVGGESGSNDNWNTESWIDGGIILPKEIILGENYPNPFNNQTSIEFILPEPAQVEIKVYNILGQELETLADGFRSAGRHEVIWDALGYASGIYFYRLAAGDKVFTRRMTLLK
jgi:photosystem II stability/assembly factor-like uncharacterized protein